MNFEHQELSENQAKENYSMREKQSAKKKAKFQFTPEQMKQLAIARLFLKKLDQALTEKAAESDDS